MEGKRKTILVGVIYFLVQTRLVSLVTRRGHAANLAIKQPPKRETIYHLKRFDYLGDVAYNFEQNKERKRNDRSSRGMRAKARYRGEGNGRDGSPGDNGAQPAKAVGRYGWSDNRKISQWPIADAFECRKARTIEETSTLHSNYPYKINNEIINSEGGKGYMPMGVGAQR
ncbi:hypothetical protein V1478_001337 [Vespula squamosa]|uniref:Uncharacterized protein n=1 Tax=Vespula squamosa TaxID=30214 RepID=A0ABD2C158_VESSQ